MSSLRHSTHASPDGTPRPHEAPAAARSADEFPPGASEWSAEFSRRDFLEVMAASLALAGLAGCNRPPDKLIAPPLVAPERQLADGAVYYATAMPWEGYARGLLALSRSGRPTKLEGNPAHPDSLGATDILMQAAVLSLYDADRSRAPRHGAAPAAWAAFEDEWLKTHRALTTRHGAGLALLTEPTTSPSQLRAIHRLLDRFPLAQWFQHTPLARYDESGRQPDYDFSRAEVVLAIDSDFLLQHPSSLRYARAFAARRRITDGRVNANRLYAIEATATITGGMADHRIPASPGRQRRLLNAVAALVEGRSDAGSGLSEREIRIVRALAADLREKAPQVLCVAGESADAEVRHWAAAMNERLGAAGVTHHELPATRSDADPRCAGSLETLVTALRRGAIDTLVIAGSNPAHTAPGDLGFAEAMQAVQRRIHLGTHDDETARLCDWHLPESHFLETWGDLRAYDGTASIIQPLINPLYKTRSALEFIHFLAEPPGRGDFDLVRETWRQNGEADDAFEARWRQWLNEGIVVGGGNRRNRPASRGVVPHLDEPDPGATTVLFRADPVVRDGRWANNAWLQELPKPMTQLVWSNPVHISPAYAAAHDLQSGDVLAIDVGAATPVKSPVWIVPGLPADCLVLHLGYGRTSAGTVGNARGVDFYPARSARSPWARSLASAHPTGENVALVSTQGHFAMEGRDIVHTATAQSPGTTGGPPVETPPSLFPAWEYREYKWGMLIDLGTCIGCKACVVACQAENNIPVVGPDQVARGREMHWLRVDQYYEGPSETPEVRFQPVPCMQCEKAPCELVCPVAATVHSSEGLNDMVYNRCIGTRYCSNNCPYKVRRFNFLDYREPAESTVYLQKNPDVTIRARGVMEKCTYCVQRINAGRISAERENRPIRDGEVRTACQQACPTEAIVFGDLNDPNSRVRQRKAEPTHYALLQELNTQPRTTYLARIINKNEDAEFKVPVPGAAPAGPGRENDRHG